MGSISPLVCLCMCVLVHVCALGEGSIKYFQLISVKILEKFIFFEKIDVEINLIKTALKLG